MYRCQTKKLIYLGIEGTESSSVKALLESYDRSPLQLVGEGVYDVPDSLGDETYEDHQWFTIIRHPFVRMCSIFSEVDKITAGFYKKYYIKGDFTSFLHFCLRVASKSPPFLRGDVWKQYGFTNPVHARYGVVFKGEIFHFYRPQALVLNSLSQIKDLSQVEVIPYENRVLGIQGVSGLETVQASDLPNPPVFQYDPQKLWSIDTENLVKQMYGMDYALGSYEDYGTQIL